MREFLIRAKGLPVDPKKFLSSIGSMGHAEYLADVIKQTLLISKGHRSDTKLTLVLEKSADYSRAIEIDGSNLGSLSGWREPEILEFLAESLAFGSCLKKNEAASFIDGVNLRATSFEKLVRDHSGALAMLETGGNDIRLEPGLENLLFIMTDHIPMARNTRKFLKRLGAKLLSLGPVTLHTSQCVTLIHNEIDRRFK